MDDSYDETFPEIGSMGDEELKPLTGTRAGAGALMVADGHGGSR